MSGFEDKLSEILSSPESMEQIFALAKSLEGNGKNDGGSTVSSGKAFDVPPIDANTMAMLTKLMQEYGREDKTVAALGAIKPFLKPEKQVKVEKAMEMAKVARIAKIAFGGGKNV